MSCNARRMACIRLRNQDIGRNKPDIACRSHDIDWNSADIGCRRSYIAASNYWQPLLLDEQVIPQPYGRFRTSVRAARRA
jgi:hypothetical protein